LLRIYCAISAFRGGVRRRGRRVGGRRMVSLAISAGIVAPVAFWSLVI